MNRTRKKREKYLFLSRPKKNQQANQKSEKMRKERKSNQNIQEKQRKEKNQKKKKKKKKKNIRKYFVSFFCVFKFVLSYCNFAMFFVFGFWSTKVFCIPKKFLCLPKSGTHQTSGCPAGCWLCSPLYMRVRIQLIVSRVVMVFVDRCKEDFRRTK